ncbi:MAG: choice-of-anchor J domain-containing protein, partial [Anaerolineae bacterium]
PNILYTDGFEAGIGGWTTPAGVGTNTWAIATTNPHSGVNHMRGLDPATATDQRLVSPAIALPTGENPVVLKFWHVPNMENSGTTACFDGGILEVSSDGGTTWTQVPNANLLVGPYTGAISSSFSNPLAGLQAWCGGTAYSNVIADVSSYAGQTVQFRFRLGSDSSVADVGWDVDDVMVQSCQASVVDPNIDVSPLSLSATQATNTTTQQTLTVANTGGGTLNWQITEDTLLATPIGSAPQMAAPSAGTTGSRSAPGGGAAPIVYSSPADFSEDFADITNLPGWFFQNNSSPLGLTNWFQGNDTVFPAHAGASTAYIGANFNNTSGAGDISNWMLTPQLNLANGDTISFWTRTATGSSWPDRVELRLSTAGASTNVGTLATDVGDFTTLLLSVNPTLVAGGYPEVWTQYTATLSGISGGASGRIAFRYFVTNGGPSGANSNYIGIDTVEYTAAQTVVCDAPSAIPWLSESPSSGSNAGSTNTPVQVTFDSTGLAVGIYTANLCVTSNDPNPGPGNGTNLVIVPVTLTVQPPTAVTLSSVTAASSQSPAPLAGLPLAALPLAAGAAMAGALAFLRRKQ